MKIKNNDAIFWLVCLLTKFLPQPLPFQKKWELVNLRGIWFSSLCENRDISSEVFFFLCLLVPLRLYEMKDAYEIDLMVCPRLFKSFALWIMVGAN